MKIVTVLLNPAIDRVIEVSGLRLGKHLPGRLKVRYPAGKALNVSRCLAVLGHPSFATGFVGKGEIDLYHDYIHLHHNELVECRFLPVYGQTRENITLIDSQTNVETHIRDAGFSITGEDVDRLREVLQESATGESIVCFCGSLPPGLKDETFLNLVDLCVRANAKVVVDSSGPHMKDIAREGIWLIKPNLAELEEIRSEKLDSTVSIHAAARHLNEKVGLVLVSAGKSGAYLVTREGSWWGYLLVSAEQIVNTVGCGDCLLGGFLAGTLEGLSPAQALCKGVAAASASALSRTPAEFTDSVSRDLERKVNIVAWSPS